MQHSHPAGIDIVIGDPADAGPSGGSTFNREDLMAKRPTETSSSKAMKKSSFIQFMKARGVQKKAKADEAQTLSEMDKKAAAEKDYHPGAGAMYEKLNAMKPAARNELLFHFDTYRDYSDWNAEPDMMPDRAAGDDHEQTASAGDDNDVDAALMGDAAPQQADDEDLRPRSLRENEKSKSLN